MNHHSSHQVGRGLVWASPSFLMPGKDPESGDPTLGACASVPGPPVPLSPQPAAPRPLPPAPCLWAPWPPAHGAMSPGPLPLLTTNQTKRDHSRISSGFLWVSPLPLDLSLFCDAPRVCGLPLDVHHTGSDCQQTHHGSDSADQSQVFQVRTGNFGGFASFAAKTELRFSTRTEVQQPLNSTWLFHCLPTPHRSSVESSKHMYSRHSHMQCPHLGQFCRTPNLTKHTWKGWRTPSSRPPGRVFCGVKTNIRNIASKCIIGRFVLDPMSRFSLSQTWLTNGQLGLYATTFH